MSDRKQEPLYLRIKEQLRSEIQAGRASGVPTRVESLDKLATKYQASRPTISKALAALAAEGELVKQAGRGAFEIALQPTPTGDLAWAGTRPTIGFVCPLYSAELPQNCFRGIDRTARRRGCRVLMAGAGESEAHERAAVHELIASGVRGLIIYPTLRADPHDPTDYLKSADITIPLVLVDTCFPEQGHAQVVFDNRRGSFQLTRWLLTQGRRHIVYFTYAGSSVHPALVARHRGFRDALEELGLPGAGVIREIAKADLYHGIDPLLDELLSAEHPIDAIMGTNDIMAMEVIDRLRRRGVRVHHDVCVVGFDYSTTTSRYRPSFTTTEADFSMMGEVAAELLLDSLESGTLPHQTYILPVPLRVRRESGNE